MPSPCRAPAFSAPGFLAALLAACLGAPDAARSQDPAAPKPDADPTLRAANALYEGIRQETLENGLRVFLKPVPGAPVVTTMVAYKVGSADEDLDQTGLAHYLEHLMFKGTDKIKPGDIDHLTLRNGGSNNAYTSNDYTIFHFDFAADRWEAALEIEADRLRNLRIDTAHEFEQEKGAVIEELRRNEDEPWDLESKAILAPLFGKASPYGHPVIGERDHVRAASARVIKAYYDKWYHPNNAALVICGGFDPDKALARVRELFGPIPRAKLPDRKAAAEVPDKRPARVDMPSKFEVNRLLLGFNTVTATDPDYPALSVLESLLSGGKTSRLYKKLVEGAEVASAASASNVGGRYPGWFSVQVDLLKGKDLDQAEKLVLDELRALAREPVTPAELKRVRHALLAGTVFARESVHGLADSIAQGVVANDLDHLKNQLPRALAVTAADVQRVAGKYLDPEKRVTVRSAPERQGDKETRRQGEGETRQARSPRPETGLSNEGLSSPPFSLSPCLLVSLSPCLLVYPEPEPAVFSLKDARRVELPNGLVLLLFENHRLPIFVAQAAVHDVRLREPADKQGVAALTGSLLDEGTEQHSGAEIAELIEDVGGELAFSSSGGGVRVLSADRELGLKLLFECLSRPRFPKEAFGRKQQSQLSDLLDAESQPNQRASKAFHAAVYGKHPLGRPVLGTRASVEALTPADCAAFHKQVFVPNNTTVALVGDFDGKAVVEEITRLTAAWKKVPLAKPEVPAVEAPKEFTQKILTMPEAAQLHFFMGHPGIRRNNPDYYKLLVMDYVLGTGPGFTDRLSARLRDREGLAYTVNANVTGSAGVEPGVFTCYIGTEAKNFNRVKAEFLEELARIREQPPSKEEVEDVQSYLLGSLPFRFTTSGEIAGQLLEVERFGLGFSYLDDYRKAVAAVTPEEVRDVARKYLDPKHMVLVAAGAIDASGKPVHKLPPPKGP